MSPVRHRRFGSRIATTLVAVILGACAGPAPDPEPWERPVDGSAGVTAWDDDGGPTSPFGPGGGDWSSPEDLVEALAATTEQSGAVRVEHAIVPGDDPDLVIGWLRVVDPNERVTLAVDLRLRIERGDGAWSVTAAEVRRHCTQRPENGACPEPGRPAPAETAEPAASSEANGGVYLALGDSVTFGIGVPRPQENGFVARVAAALADADPPIRATRVLAVPGETAAGFRDRRLDDTLAVIAELGPSVRLVTVGLGANEVLRVRREPPCESAPGGDPCRALVDAAIVAAAGALDVVVDVVTDALASNGSSATVAVLAYYLPDRSASASEPIVGSDGAVSCDPTEARPGLNDRIACVAEARSATLVDLHAAFVGREAELTRIGDGDIHPNAAGYEVIAEAILAAVGRP